MIFCRMENYSASWSRSGIFCRAFWKWFLHHNKCWRSNQFQACKTPVNKTTKENWTNVVPHREGILLEGFEIFNDYLVIEEREKGLLKINIRNWKTGETEYLPFHDPTYTAYISINLNSIQRYCAMDILLWPALQLLSSITWKLKPIKILKEQEVLGGTFKAENYISERIWAPARDGQKVPISLVYHKDTPKVRIPHFYYMDMAVMATQ